MKNKREDLVASAVSGDRAALKLLLIETRAQLQRRISKTIPCNLQGVVDADDIIQDTHVEVFRRIRDFRPEGKDPFCRWLATIAMNRLRNDLRKQRAAKRDANRVVHAHVGRSVGESSVALLDMLAAPGTTPSRAVSRAEAEAAVRAAIDALPEQYRRAVWMVYIEGRSVSEVAEKLGRTKRSIHGLCRRGLAELRNHLASATNYLSSGG